MFFYLEGRTKMQTWIQDEHGGGLLTKTETLQNLYNNQALSTGRITGEINREH